MAKGWYVARARNEVRASVSVASAGFEVFLPVQIVTRTRNRKRENVNRPLFPRYLFVAFDADLKTYGKINNCPGVANRGLIVNLSGDPIPIPDKVISDIRDREKLMLAKAGEITTGYLPGETFEIMRGHASVTAQYVGEEEGKVVALVNMFGKGHLVELEFSEVPPKNIIDARVA